MIGKIPIDQIKRAEIRDLLLGLYRKGLSKSTISLMGNAVSGPLSYALDAELIPVNPVAGLAKSLRIEKDKREHLDPLTWGEVGLFLETVAEHFGEYYPFFLCAFRTGMRLGELLALQWGDIDWNGRFIQVQCSYREGRISPTKTGKARRVDMSDHLIETLHALLDPKKERRPSDGSGGGRAGHFLQAWRTHGAE